MQINTKNQCWHKICNIFLFSIFLFLIFLHNFFVSQDESRLKWAFAKVFRISLIKTTFFEMKIKRKISKVVNLDKLYLSQKNCCKAYFTYPVTQTIYGQKLRKENKLQIFDFIALVSCIYYVLLCWFQELFKIKMLTPEKLLLRKRVELCSKIVLEAGWVNSLFQLPLLDCQ